MKMNEKYVAYTQHFDVKLYRYKLKAIYVVFTCDSVSPANSKIWFNSSGYFFSEFLVQAV